MSTLSVTASPWNARTLLAATRVLPRAFYDRPTVQVARELLGKILLHRLDGQVLAGRIVETEAYLGQNDGAAHSARGLTPHTGVIFGPPGHAYVYLCYGMYECLNLIAEPDGTAGCVLLRALEPLCGLEEITRRRPKARRLRDLASGPGKLTLALGVTRKYNGFAVTRGPLTVREFPGGKAPEIATGPRIGINHSQDLPLRFHIKDNDCVSRP